MIKATTLSSGLSFSAILFSSFYAAAQEDFQKGFVVTNANYTLFGHVSNPKFWPFVGIYKKVKLKGNRSKKHFSPEKIRFYKKDDSVYKTFFLDGQYEFLRVLSEGTVSHYVGELQQQGEEMVLDIDYLKKRIVVSWLEKLKVYLE